MHYHYPYTTTFPDPKYLHELIQSEKTRFEENSTDLEKLVTYTSASLNWISDFVLDPGIMWQRRTLLIEELYLTGTIPEWNKVIIDEAQRDPQQLKDLFDTKPAIKDLFKAAVWNEKPILVRKEDGKNKVFNGMHRVIAAIRDEKKEIDAFVGELTDNSYHPVCEPHVVYDLLRAYIRKINTDRDGLIIALRFLRKAYTNVDALLRYRFDSSGIPDKEIQLIIKASLEN